MRAVPSHDQLADKVSKWENLVKIMRFTRSMPTLVLAASFFTLSFSLASAEPVSVTPENKLELLSGTVWEGDIVSRSIDRQVRFKSPITLTIAEGANDGEWHQKTGNTKFGTGVEVGAGGEVMLSINFKKRAFRLSKDGDLLVLQLKDYDVSFQGYPRKNTVSLKRN